MSEERESTKLGLGYVWKSIMMVVIFLTFCNTQQPSLLIHFIYIKKTKIRKCLINNCDLIFFFFF